MSRWVRWSVPPIAIGFLGLLGFGLTRSPQNLPSALIAMPAPAFHLADMYEPSDSLSLAELHGKVVVLNFWASWCFPCVQEHPYLIRLDEEYSPEDVRVVGILYQDVPERGRAYMERYGGDWPSLDDPGSETAIPYGVYGPPETFIVSPDGVIAYKLVGPIVPQNFPAITGTIDSLLALRGPAPAIDEPLETAREIGDDR